MKGTEKDRNLLAPCPEYTAVVAALSNHTFEWFPWRYEAMSGNKFKNLISYRDRFTNNDEELDVCSIFVTLQAVQQIPNADLELSHFHFKT